jgi:hypothetical protein
MSAKSFSRLMHALVSLLYFVHFQSLRDAFRSSSTNPTTMGNAQSGEKGGSILGVLFRHAFGDYQYVKICRYLSFIMGAMIQEMIIFRRSGHLSLS